MKKYLKFYSILALLMVPFVMYALEAEKFKLTNFKQLDETSFTFDLELHNTGNVPFGINSAQCKIVYNQAIYGTQSANIAQNYAVTFVSTNLVGWYGKSGTTNPTDAQKVTITGNPGYIVFVTNALANPTYQQIDYLIPGAFVKLATIKVQFSVAGNPPFYVPVLHPFEEVQHNLAFDPNMINHTVNKVNAFDLSFPPAVYKVGTTGAFTPMSQPTVENLPATTANRLLAKYCFTGTGNYSDAIRWNNAITNAVAGFNVVPPTTSNAIIAGTCTINASNSIGDLTISSGEKLTLNAPNMYATRLYIDSDVANGTGTFVDLNTTGGLTVSGSTNVQQYLPMGRNWYISSPTDTAPVNIVTGTAGNSLWNYTEANSGTLLWNLIPVTGNFGVTTGYVANVASNGNINFTGGALNTGAISTNINGQPALTRTGTVSSGFNLVGNPYPSYLNWITAVASTNTGTTNMEPTMWYRSQNPSATYVFDTFITDPINGGGVGTTNFSNGVTAVTGFIPPMQAFWVRVAAGQTTGTLAFDNSMRSHQNQSVAANRLKTPGVSNATQPLLRLQVSNGTNSDEAIVYFNNNASDGSDRFDAEKMSNNNVDIPEIYTMAGTEQVVINGLKSVYSNEEIPLGFNTRKGNTFTIKATEISNFNEDTQIILKDKLLNTEQELESNTAYTFSSDVTNNTTRFSIVFKTTGITTGLKNNNSTGSESVVIYKNQNGQITVNRKDAKGEGTVTVSNAIGQLLTSMSTTGSVTVVNKNFIPGAYLVKVSLAGKNTTKKVIIN